MSEVEDETAGARAKHVAAWGWLVMMVLVGSTTATAAKFATGGLPVGLLPVLRYGTAGLCLLPWVWNRQIFSRMFRRDIGRLFLASACCVPINQTFFLHGTKLAPTTHVGLIYAACPLVVLALACLLGQEKLRWNRAAGIVLSVAGLAIVGLGNLWRSKGAGAAAAAGDPIQGDLLLIGAVVSWGAYLTFNKPLVDRHGPLPVLAVTFVLGALLDLPIALASTDLRFDFFHPSTFLAWRGLAWLAFGATLCGLAAQNQALRLFDASQVAAVGNISPLLTIVWGVSLLGEELSPALVIGGLATLAGVAWTGRSKSKPNLAERNPLPRDPLLPATNPAADAA